MARDLDGHPDARRVDRVRRDSRARTPPGDAGRCPRLLDVPHRTAGLERSRLHPHRPQVERAVPCESPLAGKLLRRACRRHARRVPAAEPRPLRLRHLLGPADGPGAVRMAAETPLRSHPQRGRVLPAWAFIGWRWVWRSPAAAIVPLLQPFFFLYFLHVIAPPELFPLQVAGAMLFSTQNIGSWCLSDSAVFRIELRLQDIFVASPVDKVRYLFGIAFSNLIPAM